jgi:hypothetical protein
MLLVVALATMYVVLMVGLIAVGLSMRGQRVQRSSKKTDELTSVYSRTERTPLHCGHAANETRRFDEDSNKMAVSNFITALTEIAPAAGQGDYAFRAANGGTRGFVQIIPQSDHQIMIHRLWTLEREAGNGAAMLDALCKIADQHRVILKLKPLPFGRKPYPLDREQLLAWYERHGFVGNRRSMIRAPKEVNHGNGTRDDLFSRS